MTNTGKTDKNTLLYYCNHLL